MSLFNFLPSLVYLGVCKMKCILPWRQALELHAFWSSLIYHLTGFEKEYLVIECKCLLEETRLTSFFMYPEYQKDEGTMFFKLKNISNATILTFSPRVGIDFQLCILKGARTVLL